MLSADEPILYEDLKVQIDKALSQLSPVLGKYFA